MKGMNGGDRMFPLEPPKPIMVIKPTVTSKKFSFVAREKPMRRINTHGLYALRNSKTGRVYVGQSSEMFIRIRNQVTSARKNAETFRDFPQLKQDWADHGEGSFEILIYHLGAEYADGDFRRYLESRYNRYFLALDLSYNRVAADRFEPGIRPFAADSAIEEARRKAIRIARRTEVAAPLESPDLTLSPRAASNAMPVRIEGEVYRSLKDASNHLGFHRTTIKRRCRSEDVDSKNWEFITMEEYNAISRSKMSAMSARQFDERNDERQLE
jgi:hypothetical protein